MKGFSLLEESEGGQSMVYLEAQEGGALESPGVRREET